MIQNPTLAVSAGTAYIGCRPAAANLGADDGSESSNSPGEEAEMFPLGGGGDRGESAEGGEERLGVLGDGGDDDVAVGLDTVSVVVAVDL